jgi:hypothetical protein
MAFTKIQFQPGSSCIFYQNVKQNIHVDKKQDYISHHTISRYITLLV